MKFSFYVLGLVCAMSLPSLAQDNCDQLCGWWLSDDSYEQWDGKYRSLLLIDGKDDQLRSFLLRMPGLVDFSKINTLTGTMMDAVLTDSSHLSPVLLTLGIEVKKNGKLKITEQEDRFGLPATPVNLVDHPLNVGKFSFGPKGKFENLEGNLDLENKSIVLTNKAGQQVTYQQL